MAVGQGGAVLIPPEVQHQPVGRLMIRNLVVPPFDPDDESIDWGRDVRSSGHTGPGASPERKTGMRSRKRRVSPQQASRREPRLDLRERSRHASLSTTTDYHFSVVLPPFLAVFCYRLRALANEVSWV
jgi:hypothetical protein